MIVILLYSLVNLGGLGGLQYLFHGSLPHCVYAEKYVKSCELNAQSRHPLCEEFSKPKLCTAQFVRNSVRHP